MNNSYKGKLNKNRSDFDVEFAISYEKEKLEDFKNRVLVAQEAIEVLNSKKNHFHKKQAGKNMKFGIFGVVFIVLLVVKLLGIQDFSWLVVLSPLIIGFLLNVVFLLGFTWLIKNK